jgi:uncharacterized protein YkwD
MKRVILSFILVLITISFSHVDATVSSLNTGRIEKLVYEMVNEERKEKGLHRLNYNQELEKLARMHSANMAEHGFFSHVDHNKMNVDERRKSYSPHLFMGAIGENIASVPGRGEKEVAKKLISQWMGSEGHRENILNKKYSHIGVGITQKGNRFYATQVFGDLMAVFVTQMPEVVPFGSEQELEFKFLGKFPKDKLTISVHFPDKTAKFYTKGRSYLVGRGLYEPQWDDDNFNIRIKFDKGTGWYEVNLGRYGAYYPEGLKILVK